MLNPYHKYVDITNDIKKLKECIVYNNISYYKHPKYNEYFFNKNNILNYIKLKNNKYEIRVFNQSKKENRFLITITTKNIKIVVNAARLILETFTNIDNSNLVASHIDDDVYNNKLDNLEWKTQKENMIVCGLNNEINQRIFVVLNIFYESTFNKIINLFPRTVVYNNLHSSNKYEIIDNRKFLSIPFLQNHYISVCGKYVIEKTENSITYKNVYLPSCHMAKRYPTVFILEKRYKIHHLLLSAIYKTKYNYNKNKCILHIDDNKTNNNINNLIFGSQKENNNMHKLNVTYYKNISRHLKNENNKLYVEILNKIKNNLDLCDKRYLLNHINKLIDTNNQSKSI